MKATRGENVFNIINYAILALVSMSMLYPFLTTIAKSLSSNDAVTMGLVYVLPVDFNFLAYTNIFKESLFVAAFKNTIAQTLLGTTFNMLVTIITAYPLSKRELIGRKPIFMFFLVTMFFSGGLIPGYLLIRNLGLLDSMAGLIIPGAMGMYYVILMKNFFENVPDSLEDAATIDGCNEINALFRVILPVSLPMLATITLFYAVGHWNTFMNGVIIIRSPEKYPLQVFLSYLITANQNSRLVGKMLQMTQGKRLFGNETLKNAAILVSIIPIIAAYPFLQRYFIKGIMIGSVKG